MDWSLVIDPVRLVEDVHRDLGDRREAQTPRMATPTPATATFCSKTIRLLRMETQKDGNTTVYLLEFSDGTECWAVHRRYSELLRCHVQLLEFHDASELPPFPPKEPIFQKFLGNVEKRSEFVQQRELELHNYITGLLDMPGLHQTQAVQRLVAMDPATPPTGGGSLQDSRTLVHDDEEQGVASFSGFRVRLTDEPGGLEVVVRATTQADVSLQPCSVRLTFQELAEEEGRSPEESPLEIASSSPSRSVTDRCGEELQRFEEELELHEDEEVSKRFLLPPGTFWQVSGRGTTAAGIVGSAVSLRVRAPGEKEFASLPASALAAAAKRSPPSAQSSKVEPAGIPPAEQAQDVERAEADVVEFSTAVEAQDVERPEDQQESTIPDKSESEDAVEIRPIAVDEAEEGKGKGRQRSRPQRRLERGPEDHRVLSYRGHVAASYLKSVQEKQQIAIERAPHRFEAVNGAVRSVPQRFSAVGARPTEDVQSTEPRDAEALDQSRREQELRQFQQDERRAARWISAVTGHPDVGAVMTGEKSFEAAIQSGEALCDLVNAVWPGRIVGILRGEVRPLRRVENIQKFCIACRGVGVEDVTLLPAEVAVGKDTRNVLRCLFSLNGVLPEAPVYKGPRLDDDFDSRQSDSQWSVDKAVEGDMADRAADVG